MTRVSLVLSFVFVLSLGLLAAGCDTDPKQPTDTATAADTATDALVGGDVQPDIGPDVPTVTQCTDFVPMSDPYEFATTWQSWNVCTAEQKLCIDNICQTTDPCTQQDPATVYSMVEQKCLPQPAFNFDNTTWKCTFKLITGYVLSPDITIFQKGIDIMVQAGDGNDKYFGTWHGGEFSFEQYSPEGLAHYYYHATTVSSNLFSGEGYEDNTAEGGSKTTMTITCGKQ